MNRTTLGFPGAAVIAVAGWVAAGFISAATVPPAHGSLPSPSPAPAISQESR